MMGGFGGSMGGVGDRGKGKRPIQVKFEVCFVSLGSSLTSADSSPDSILYYIRHQRQVSQNHRTQGKRNIQKDFEQTLIQDHSCNTLPCHGSAISHNQATLPSVYQTRNRNDNTIMESPFYIDNESPAPST
jgi:hypothetical protein